MALYVDIVRKINALERGASIAKKAELSFVIARIKSEIKKYGLTPQDTGLKRPKLGGTSSQLVTKRLTRRADSKRAGPNKTTVAPKYLGPQGVIWVGRGKKPCRISEFEASGLDIASIRIADVRD